MLLHARGLNLPPRRNLYVLDGEQLKFKKRKNKDGEPSTALRIRIQSFRQQWLLKLYFLPHCLFFLTRTNKRLERKRKQHNSKKKARCCMALAKEKKSKHGWLKLLCSSSAALVLGKQGRIRPKQKKPRRKQEAGMLPPATATGTNLCPSCAASSTPLPTSHHIIICSHIAAAAAAASVVVPAAPPPVHLH